MAAALIRRIWALAAVLSAACGQVSNSGSADAGASDAGLDVVDASTDVADAPVEAPPDAAGDVVVDSPEDVVSDSPQEAGSSWVPINLVGAPAGSYGASAWTGSRFIIAGGDIGGLGQDQPTNHGAAYDPTTDTWKPIADAPRAFYGADFVWTATQLFVFNQQAGDWAMLYSPGADSWTDATPPTPATPRSGAVVATAGARILVWGGHAWQGTTPVLVDPVLYDPAANSWQAAPVAGDAPVGLSGQVAVSTGNSVIVWGGGVPTSALTTTPVASGAVLDVASGVWHAMSNVAAPAARYDAVAVWTGTEMLVLGGRAADGSPAPGGGLYDPALDSWRKMAPAPAPPECTAWSGSRFMLYKADTPAGGAYDPTIDTWLPMDVHGPYAHSYCAWVGTGFLVYGNQVGAILPP